MCVCVKRYFLSLQHLELTLPESRTEVTLDQRMAETEGYYQMLQEHIQSLSQSLSATEEASQIRQTAKTMLEALRQCIDIMKTAQARKDLCEGYTDGMIESVCLSLSLSGQARPRGSSHSTRGDGGVGGGRRHLRLRKVSQ